MFIDVFFLLTFNDKGTNSHARQRAATVDPESPDDGATRFFRRMHVISTVVGPLLSLYGEQSSVVGAQGSDDRMSTKSWASDSGAATDNVGNFAPASIRHVANMLSFLRYLQVLYLVMTMKGTI
jgi:hypothetical protein